MKNELFTYLKIQLSRFGWYLRDVNTYYEVWRVDKRWLTLPYLTFSQEFNNLKIVDSEITEKLTEVEYYIMLKVKKTLEYYQVQLKKQEKAVRLERKI